MQTPGKGQVLQHLRSPIPPRPTRGICLQSWDRAAHSPHPGLLFPFLPSSLEPPGPPRARELRGRSAEPPPRRESPAVIKQPPGMASAAAAVPARRRGDSGDKGSGVLSPCSATTHKKTPASGVPDVVTKGCRCPTPSQQKWHSPGKWHSTARAPPAPQGGLQGNSHILLPPSPPCCKPGLKMCWG